MFDLGVGFMMGSGKRYCPSYGQIISWSDRVYICYSFVRGAKYSQNGGYKSSCTDIDPNPGLYNERVDYDYVICQIVEMEHVCEMV